MVKNKVDMNGINFIQPLFHAVAEGRKTMTRRVVKPPKKAYGGIVVVKNHTGDIVDVCWADEHERFSDENGNNNVIKPRYKVGETLYLKEPYDRSYIHEIGDKYDNPLQAAGDPKCWETIYRYSGIYIDAEWKPAISMPAKYARYFIEITGVKAERLQDISDEDCLKEGIMAEKYFSGKGTRYFSPHVAYYKYPDIHKCGSLQHAFAALIDKIKRGTWDSNPFVWVYEFKLVK